MVSYRQMKFLCNGQDKYMVCAGHDGSSALEAIYNCAFLTFGSLEENSTLETYISEEKLKLNMQQMMTTFVNEILRADPSKFDDLKHDHDLLVKLIQGFGPSNHIAPCLSSIFSFEKSDISALTYLLNIHMLHAWVLSPTEEIIYESVRHFSLEKLKIYHNSMQDQVDHSEATKQKLAVIQGLLESGNKQLTTHGYTSLHEMMVDGVFAVLYWDNKFHVIHKMYSDLLLLETNTDILDKYSTIVWRIFEEVEKESIYLTGEYFPASDQPNIAAAKEWYCQKISKIPGETSDEKAVKVSGVTQVSDGVIPSSGQLSRSQRKRQVKKKKATKIQNQREDHQAEGSLQQKLSKVSVEVEETDEKIVKGSDETSIGRQLSKKQQKHQKEKKKANDLHAAEFLPNHDFF